MCTTPQINIMKFISNTTGARKKAVQRIWKNALKIIRGGDFYLKKFTKT